MDEKKIAAVDFTLTEDLRVEGWARDLVREIQELRKKQNLSISDKINVVVEGKEEYRKAVEKFGEDIKRKIIAQRIDFGSVTSVSKII